MNRMVPASSRGASESNGTLSLKTLKTELFFSGSELGSSSCVKAKNAIARGGRIKKERRE